MFWIVYLAVSIPFVRSACNPYIGPAGSYECVQLDGYIGHQYATCLSNDYIKAKSRGTHVCRSLFGLFTPNYCYYQCQLVLHSKETGVVDIDCRCSPFTFIPKDSSTLSDSCYSPTGEKCNWYTTCLEKKYPCLNEKANYLIEFSKYLCDMYDENRVTGVGREWIDTTRKCLQVSLAPLLQQWLSLTCSDVERKVLASFDCCFTGNQACSTNGSLSICHLSLSDFSTILLEMKYQLSNKFSSFQSFEGVYKLFQTGINCHNQSTLGKALLNNEFTGPINLVDLKVKLNSEVGIESKTTLDEMAFHLVNSIASQSSWKQLDSNLVWLGYGRHENTNDTNIKHVRLTVINRSSMFVHLMYFKQDEIVKKLMSDIKQGYIWINHLLINNQQVTLLEASLCLTYPCVESSTVVIPPLVKGVRTTTTTIQPTTKTTRRPAEKTLGRNSDIILKVSVNTIAISMLTSIIIIITK